MVNVDKTSGLKYFTIADLKSWQLSYELSKHFSKDFKGTAIDILTNKDIPFKDKLEVVLRPEICSDRLMRLFAVYCYRDTLNWVKNPDPRSIEAANVAERYANGKATEGELESARSAAQSAAWSAESAAWSAVESAWSTAGSAQSAAWSAAWSTAGSAQSAARSAAGSAAGSAWSAAGSAVESAAQERYISKLIEMLKVEAAETLFDIVATA